MLLLSVLSLLMFVNSAHNNNQRTLLMDPAEQLSYNFRTSGRVCKQKGFQGEVIAVIAEGNLLCKLEETTLDVYTVTDDGDENLVVSVDLKCNGDQHIESLGQDGFAFGDSIRCEFNNVELVDKRVTFDEMKRQLSVQRYVHSWRFNAKVFEDSRFIGMGQCDVETDDSVGAWVDTSHIDTRPIDPFYKLMYFTFSLKTDGILIRSEERGVNHRAIIITNVVCRPGGARTTYEFRDVEVLAPGIGFDQLMCKLKSCMES